MRKKKVMEKSDEYSSEEMRSIMHSYIESSAERLRRRLREAWKKQATVKRRIPHEVAV